LTTVLEALLAMVRICNLMVFCMMHVGKKNWILAAANNNINGKYGMKMSTIDIKVGVARRCCCPPLSYARFNVVMNKSWAGLLLLPPPSAYC
jgi:hypothetical protein